MLAYRFRIVPKSPWVTPWHADSVFGALCWASTSLFGKEHLEAQLRQFKAGEPPFVISDCFPEDLLPFPAGIPVDAPPEKKDKAVWISRESFGKFAQGELEKIPPAAFGREANPFENYSRVHASVDRDSGRVEEGLFEEEMSQFRKRAGFRWLSLYVKGSRDTVESVGECLHAVASRGFGRKSSTGLGNFDLYPTAERCPWLEGLDGANGFMALSHFLPAAGDPAEGAWRVHVTHPKFQGDLVTRYLKGTIRFLAPGSVFRASAPKDWYGRALPLARPEFPEAIQYGFCLAAPVRLGAS